MRGNRKGVMLEEFKGNGDNSMLSRVVSHLSRCRKEKPRLESISEQISILFFNQRNLG